jgi:hypothetical protein
LLQVPAIDKLDKVVARRLVVHVMRLCVTLYCVALKGVSDGVLKHRTLPVVQGIKPRNRSRELSHSLGSRPKMLGQLDEGLAHYVQLMQYEIGEVTIVGLSVREGHVVRLWASIDGPRDRKEFRHLIPMPQHAPVVQGSRNSAVPVSKRMFVPDPEVHNDRPNDGMNEHFLSVS